MTPAHHRAQHLGMQQRVTLAACEQMKRLVQAPRNLARIQKTCSRRSQLDRERTPQGTLEAFLFLENRCARLIPISRNQAPQRRVVLVRKAARRQFVIHFGDALRQRQVELMACRFIQGEAHIFALC